MLPASEQQPLRGRTQKRWTPGVCGCRVRCYVPRWCWWRHRTGAWGRWWRPTPTAAGWEDLWTTETQRGETSVNWVRGNDTTATVSEWPRSWRLCVCVCVCTVVHMILFQSISTKTMRVSHPLRGRKTDFNLPPQSHRTCMMRTSLHVTGGGKMGGGARRIAPKWPYDKQNTCEVTDTGSETLCSRRSWKTQILRETVVAEYFVVVRI